MQKTTLLHMISDCTLLLLLLNSKTIVQTADAPPSPTASACPATATANLTDIEKLQRTYTNWRAQLAATNYVATSPPNYPNWTTVAISVWPYALGYINEADKIIRTTNKIVMEWNDTRLSWSQTQENSSSQCGEEEEIFPYMGKLPIMTTDDVARAHEQLIWIPAIYMHGRQDSFSSPMLRLFLQVSSDGRVRLEANLNELHMCRIRTRKFPFDEQLCYVLLGGMQYVEFQSRPELQLDVENLNRERYTQLVEEANFRHGWYETNEWRMSATYEHFRASMHGKVELIDTFSLIAHPIFLTRKSVQPAVSWIVSPVVLSVSSVVGMFAGCPVGERLSFGAAIIVTMTLMINDLRSVLGIGEDGYPILGQLYIALELTLILATMSSSLPRKLYKMSSERGEAAKRSRGRAAKNDGISNVLSSTIGGWKAEKEEKDSSLRRKPMALCFELKSEHAYDMLVMFVFLAMQLLFVFIAVVLWLDKTEPEVT